jgi:hypothetical protein
MLRVPLLPLLTLALPAAAADRRLWRRQVVLAAAVCGEHAAKSAGRARVYVEAQLLHASARRAASC